MIAILSSSLKQKRNEFFILSPIQKVIVVFSLVFFASLSGFIYPFDTNNQLFLRTSYLQTRSPEKDIVYASQSATAYKRPSQVNVMGIGTQRQISPTQGPDTVAQWGVAKKIDAHTYTIKLGDDQHTASAQEILSALNSYRQKHGRSSLAWNDGLASYAQSRANFFNSSNKLDSHAGFMDYVNNQDGFHKLGFGGLGENSSIGYHLEAVHLIEWVYAADAGHNNNQLSSEWRYVGIGVNNTATDLVFGGEKL